MANDKKNVTFSNGSIEETTDKNAVPASIDLKIPVDVNLVADFVRDFLRAGYDISIEQIYSDSFAAGHLDHYLLSVNGDLNFETIPVEIQEV